MSKLKPGFAPGKETAAAEEGGEEKKEAHPLFPKKEEPKGSSSGEGESSGEGGFEESPLFAKRDGPTQKTFDKRIGKLVSQRENEREGRLKAESEAASLKEQVQVISDRHAKNPELFAHDVAFMDNIDELSKSHPEVLRIAKAVQEFGTTGVFKLGGKEVKPLAPASTTEKEQEKETAKGEDPRVAKVLEKAARKEIASALNAMNVKPSFVKLVTKEILENGEVDISDLDSDEVEDLARKFIADNDLSESDVLKTAEPKKEGEGEESPEASGGGGKAAGVVKTPEEKQKEAEKAEAERPKTIEEWDAQRTARRDAAFADLSVTDS